MFMLSAISGRSALTLPHTSCLWTFFVFRFYYVRNNKTRYFFNSFLLAGDLVRSIVVTKYLSSVERACFHGLKVKVFSLRDFMTTFLRACLHRQTFLTALSLLVPEPQRFSHELGRRTKE
jgi:hypothetical protein